MKNKRRQQLITAGKAKRRQHDKYEQALMRIALSKPAEPLSDSERAEMERLRVLMKHYR